MRPKSIRHEFVEYIPDEVEEGVLYISIPFATAVHACCCGCGSEVVTPLSPTDWRLTFDGETVSLHPSIGNWSFACQSHYWIQNNRIRWAPRWSQKEINAGRAADALAKQRYFDARTSESSSRDSRDQGDKVELHLGRMKQTLWQRLRKLWS